MKHLTQIEEKVPQGTSPLIVDSTTVVSNLNADLLDGKHASDFKLASDPSSPNLTLTKLTLGHYQINFNSGTDKLEFLYIT